MYLGKVLASPSLAHPILPPSLVFLLVKYLSDPATSHSLHYQLLNLYLCLVYDKKLLTGFPELTFLFPQSLSYDRQSCPLKKADFTISSNHLLA